MNAAGSFAWRRIGGNALDVPVAALAGLSVAFVAFAAPSDLLGEWVGSTGLSSLLPAAEPPLGMKARIGLGGAGAVLVFAFAFLLLRWLDRRGRSPEFDFEADEEDEVTQPRLRRRDFHPDAPSCRPISATRDLGDPERLTARPYPEFPREPSDWSPEPEPLDWNRYDEPLPDFLDDQASPPASEPLGWEPESDPFGWADEVSQPTAEAEPAQSWSEPEESGLVQPWSEPDAPEPAQRWSEPDTPEPAQRWSEPENVAWPPQDEPLVRAARDEPTPVAWPPAEPVADPASAVPHEPGSLADLMERLERGLARRRAPVSAPQPAAPTPPVAPQVFPEASDDRLQSAIENLQRLAQNGD